MSLTLTLCDAQSRLLPCPNACTDPPWNKNMIEAITTCQSSPENEGLIYIKEILITTYNEQINNALTYLDNSLGNI